MRWVNSGEGKQREVSGNYLLCTSEETKTQIPSWVGNSFPALGPQGELVEQKPEKKKKKKAVNFGQLCSVPMFC